MSEPTRGTKVTCPHCGWTGTAKITVAEGTKIKCPGCGQVYQYHESYKLEDQPPDQPLPTSTLSDKVQQVLTAARGALGGSTPVSPVPRRPAWSFTMTFLKLPGWIAIATGILQFCIVFGGTSIGTYSGYQNARKEYAAARHELLEKQRAAIAQQQTLDAEKHRLLAEQQRLKNEMTRLAQEMDHLIKQCDLKVEVPANPPTAPAAQPQPTPPQPAPEKTCLEQYQERKELYQLLMQQWQELDQKLNEVEGELTVVEREVQKLQIALYDLPWPIGKLPAALAESIFWSAGISAIFPLGIAYLAWVLGAVMICVGFIWLALVRRIFLAPPDCYLRTQA